MLRKSLQIRIVFWAGVCLLITGGVILGFSVYITNTVAQMGVTESRELVGQMAREAKAADISAAEKELVNQSRAAVKAIRGELEATFDTLRASAIALRGVKSSGVVGLSRRMVGRRSIST